MKKLLILLFAILCCIRIGPEPAQAQMGGGGTVVTTGPMTMFVNVEAAAATTTIPYSCWLTPIPVALQSWQATVGQITESGPPIISLCDTGTAANPNACGTTLASTTALSAAGSQTVSVNATVASGHYVCAFFKSGTATLLDLEGTVNAAPAGVLPGYSRSWLSGSSNAVVSNSAANYWPANGTGTAGASTLEGDMTTLAPTVGTARNLKCTLTTAAGVVTVAGGTNYVLALRQNIATSPLTCTITAAINTCVDTTDSVTINVGDQLDFIDTPTGTPTALVAKCTVEVDS